MPVPTPLPGPLMIIGGAEDKLRKRTILKEFVAASGGADARIAVIPTASSLGDEVVEVYDALFRRLGAGEVVPVRPESREEAHDPDLVKAVDEATGVFMTGGNQLKLSAIICGTPLGDAIVEAHRRGAVVAGTSAGASIQSSHMVAFGVGGATPKQRMTQVAAGLGPGQHGRHRPALRPAQPLRPAADDRGPVAAAARHRRRRGHLRGGHPRGRRRRTEVLRVIGRGCVTIFDPARIVSNAHEAKRSSPLLASGVVLHVLPAGAAFDLTTRTLVPQPRDDRPRGRRRDRRGPARHAPAGPRHRRRRRQPGRPASTAGPHTHQDRPDTRPRIHHPQDGADPP